MCEFAFAPRFVSCEGLEPEPDFAAPAQPPSEFLEMRPLTEEETKAVFEKLYKFIGKSIKSLIDRPDEPYCFRLQKNRVFYVRESLMKRATNISRDKLVSLGTCIGKLTHSGKFRQVQHVPCHTSCFLLCLMCAI